jgi:putative membrane protein
MKIVNRWGLAAGLAAALALFGNAQAQSSASGTGSSGSSGASGSSGSRGDTGGPTPSGTDRSSASGSTTPQGGSPGSSSDSGARSGSTGSSATGSAATGSGAEASGRQAASGTGTQKVDKGLEEKLQKLHAAHQSEIKLGQMAMQNAQSPEVKQFAQQMQTDHQRADQKLTQTAQSIGVNLEGEAYKKEADKARKDMEKLQSKTGQEFDKEYMSHMVKDHEKDVKAVDEAKKDAQKGKHTELAALLDQAHTGMQGHLQHAKQIEKQVKEGGKAQGRTPSGSSGASGTGTGSGQSGTSGSSGSRGDTGGPTPTGRDPSAPKESTGPQGGAPGSSSDSGGQRTTK